MLIAAFLTLLSPGQGAPVAPPEAKTKEMQLVYLVDAKNPPAMEKEAQGRAQMAHLKRLEELWTARQAVLVGPMANAGATKGIVLLDLPTQSEAVELINGDPWVKAGQLAPEIRTVQIPPGVLGKGPTFMAIEPHWFCQVVETGSGSRRAPTDHTKLLAAHADYMAKALVGKDIEIRASFLPEDDHREFIVLRNEKQEVLDKIFAEDPAVLAGVLKVEINQLFVAKGTFRTPSSKAGN